MKVGGPDEVEGAYGTEFTELDVADPELNGARVTPPPSAHPRKGPKESRKGRTRDHTQQPGFPARAAGYTPPGRESEKSYRYAYIAGLSTFLITGGLAFFAGSVLASAFFGLPLLAAIATGAVWGVFVVTIDLLILAQYPSLGSSRWSLIWAAITMGIVALARIGLAVGMGFLVAEPVSLFFWEDTIQRQIAVDNSQKLLAKETQLLAEAVEDGEQALGAAAAAQQSVIDAELAIRLQEVLVDQELQVGSNSCKNASTGGDGPCYRQKLADRDALLEQLRVTEAVCRMQIQGTAPAPGTPVAASIKELGVGMPQMPISDAIASLPGQVQGRLEGYEDTLNSVAYGGRIVAMANIRKIASGEALESPLELSEMPEGTDISTLRGELTGKLSRIQAAVPSCQVPRLPADRNDTDSTVAIPTAAEAIASAVLNKEQAPSVDTAGPEDSPLTIKAVTRTEAVELERHFWVVLIVLILIDLLPLSYKALSGRSQRAVADAELQANVNSADLRERVRSDARRNLRIRQLTYAPIDEAWHLHQLRRFERRHQMVRAFLGRKVQSPSQFGRGPLPPRPISAEERHRRPTPPSPPQPPEDLPSSPRPHEDTPEGQHDLGELETRAFKGDAAIGKKINGWRITEVIQALDPGASRGWQAVWRVASEKEKAGDLGSFVMKIFRQGNSGPPEEYLLCQNIVGDPENTANGIAPILACEESGPFYFIIMPFYEEGTLADYFKKYPNQRNLWNTIQIALAVARGLVHVSQVHGGPEMTVSAHNDIKPTNIAVEVPTDGRGPQARLLDWGLAGSSTGGTPFYTAPERIPGEIRQAAGSSQDLGQYGEIFGVAAVMYWAITGLPPRRDVARAKGINTRDPSQLRSFEGSSQRATPIKDRLRMPDQVPQELAELIDRWLDPDPLQRILSHGRPLNADQRAGGAWRYAWHELRTVSRSLNRDTSALPLGDAYAKENQ